MPSTVPGEPYADTLTVTGDPAPTVTVVSGHLPPGITLSPNGTLSGAAKALGDYAATLQASNGVGTPAKRTITIDSQVAVNASDVSTQVSSTGKTPMHMVVTLSQALSVPVSMHWATQNLTATAGVDYVAASGTLTFAAGQTQRTITVYALGNPQGASESMLNEVLKDMTHLVEGKATMEIVRP